MLFLLLIVNFFYYVHGSCDYINVTITSSNRKLIIREVSKLNIFQFSPITSTFTNSWNIGNFEIIGLKVEDFHFYFGENVSHVHNLCLSSSSTFNIYDSLRRLIFGRNIKDLTFQFDPFIDQAIGIQLLNKLEHYRVIVSYKINYFLFLLTIFSCIVFIKSRKLSESVCFHFTCAVLLSLCGTTILIAFVMSRFLPFRKSLIMLGVLGNSVLFSILINTKEKLLSFIKDNMLIASIYFSVVSFVTILVMYYYYPDTINRKAVNIINILLKLVSIFWLFYSVNNIITFFTILTILLIPFRLLFIDNPILKRWWFRRFPKKRCFIPINRYPDILKENTERELSKLREYLRSPKFDTWGAVKKCKSVERLAAFVETGAQCSDAEVKSYYSTDCDISDDDSSIEFISQ